MFPLRNSLRASLRFVTIASALLTVSVAGCSTGSDEGSEIAVEDVATQPSPVDEKPADDPTATPTETAGTTDPVPTPSPAPTEGPTATPTPSPVPTATTTPSPTPEPTPTPDLSEFSDYLAAFRAQDLTAVEADIDDQLAIRLGEAFCADQASSGMRSIAANEHDVSYSTLERRQLKLATVVAAYGQLCPEVGGFMTFTGTGDDVIAIDGAVIDGLAIVFAEHGGSRNFIVSVLDENGARSEGIVNEIGPYRGWKVLVEEDIAFLQVQADGTWTVDFQHVSTAADVEVGAGQVITGRGDDVLQLELDGPLIAEFACPGCDSNVFVRTYGTGRSIVNEIGSYVGTIVIPTDTLLLEIGTHNGRGDIPAWTLTPE